MIERVESVEAEGINPVTGKPRKFYAEFKVTGAKKHVDDIMNKVAYA